jgi:hypothetical protein
MSQMETGVLHIHVQENMGRYAKVDIDLRVPRDVSRVGFGCFIGLK